MKNIVYFVTEYQYIEIIDRHTAKVQTTIQEVDQKMFSTLTEARLYISQVWRQYQSHNYSYPSPDAFVLYEDRNKTRAAKLFQIESEDDDRYPTPNSQENTNFIVRYRHPLELQFELQD